MTTPFLTHDLSGDPIIIRSAGISIPTDEIPICNEYGVVVAWSKVDPEDFQRFIGLCWRMKDGYAAHAVKTSKGARDVMLHRAVMNAPKGSVIDHHNTDELDNRKHNLRFATKGQNSQNRKGPNATGTSGYLGVYWHEQAQKWQARICKQGKAKSLGLFATKEAAHAARVKAEVSYFGEFAPLHK